MVYHPDTQKNAIHHLTGFGKHSGYKVPGKYSLYFCEQVLNSRVKTHRVNSITIEGFFQVVL